ncbi:hypothetical protein HA41_16995 [Pantoea conspicua]|uniref:DUF5862 domain-containing protein n=1 Tax=Pantoea conspicua TaxID=472705 RepID=A0A1X1BS58_9GAMM|nr:hypothetical protein [Pantoea conspicua]ORM50998.1 hypothetical protein HA41_16995 [Pantoea conspicua]
MRNLNNHELHIVAGGAPTATEVELFGEAVLNGAVIGATTLAFSFGKWAGFAGPLTFGLAQLAGVIAGLTVGAIGGAIYGASHTPAESEAFFLDIVKALG